MKPRRNVANFMVGVGLAVQLDESNCVVLELSRWEGEHLRVNRHTVTNVQALKDALDWALLFQQAQDRL